MGKAKSERDKTPNKAVLRAIKTEIESWGSGVPGTIGTTLAIDPGTANLALCLISPDEVITSKIELPKFEDIAGRVRYLYAVIEQWVLVYKPQLIVKEGPAFFAKFGVADAGRVQYAIEHLAFEHRIPLITVTPMSMRSYVGASGKGKTKSDTKLRVFQKWGLEFPSEDETDAYGIARTGLAIIAGEYKVTEKKPSKKKE